MIKSLDEIAHTIQIGLRSKSVLTHKYKYTNLQVTKNCPKLNRYRIGMGWYIQVNKTSRRVFVPHLDWEDVLWLVVQLHVLTGDDLSEMGY